MVGRSKGTEHYEVVERKCKLEYYLKEEEQGRLQSVLGGGGELVQASEHNGGGGEEQERLHGALGGSGEEVQASAHNGGVEEEQLYLQHAL